MITFNKETLMENFVFLSSLASEKPNPIEINTKAYGILDRNKMKNDLFTKQLHNVFLLLTNVMRIWKLRKLQKLGLSI